MSYSVGQDSRHEGKATVLRDFNNVRAPNKQQKKKCDPLMSVCGFSLMFAATGGSTDRPGE